MLLYHSRMRSADKNKTVCGGVFTAYVPIGFLTADSISSAAVQIVPNAALYHFGVLTSSMHMAWMRAVCGRLKSDYRYSKDIVYNNFPWPYQIDNGKLIIENELSEKQKLSILNSKLSIEKTAQSILDVRAKYPDCSLADLYDETTMSAELRKAHQANDKAVMAAYGFSTKMTESECVAEPFKLYENLTKTQQRCILKETGTPAKERPPPLSYCYKPAEVVSLGRAFLCSYPI